LQSESEETLKLEWDAAEAAIKAAESLNRRVIIPAIYELRYAGRMVVDALATSEKSLQSDLFADAIARCRRARAEAEEAQAMYLIAFGSQLRPRETWIPLDTEKARFLQIISKIGEALRTSRESSQSRNIFPDQMDEMLREATKLCLQLKDLDASLASTARAHRWWRYLLGTVGGVVAAVPFVAPAREILQTMLSFIGS
jgi:hypothetical protein